MKFHQHAAALNYQAGKESFDHHWKQLNELYTKLLQAAIPWEKHDSTQNNEKLFDAWKQMFGDPDDPNVKRRIDNAVTDLYGQQPKANVNTNMPGRGEAAWTPSTNKRTRKRSKP
jgi:hypothetical protein